MKSNSIRNCGAFSLVLGIALASGAVYAGQNTGAKSGFIKLTESNVGPIVNDYSDRSDTGYDGPRPQHGANKAYRDTRKDKEQADKQGNRQEKFEPRSEPMVNDYSSMGAEYTAKEESPDEEASESSGDSAAPGDFSTANLAVGHEKYNANCAQCHGQDAVGSTFAPSLVNRLKRLDYASFVDVVTNGKTSFNSSTGGYNVMPGWKNNAAVMEYMNPLWGYLKARADGDLGTGRPQ